MLEVESASSMSDIDEELAQLLHALTFSMEECRAKSRAARTPHELECILRGEKKVKEARAERLKVSKAVATNLSTLANASGAAHTVSPTGHSVRSKKDIARIEKGREAAQMLRASAHLRFSLRDSWARSSVASEAGSAASFSFSSNARKTRDAKQIKQVKLDLSSLRNFTARYNMDSARSMASSVDVVSEKRA